LVSGEHKFTLAAAASSQSRWRGRSDSFAQVAAGQNAVVSKPIGARIPYSILAGTTGYGKPPAVGALADIFVNIHDTEPTGPEVRPLARGAKVAKVIDPNPSTTNGREVQLELQLTQAEIDLIKEHEHRHSFTFHPADPPQDGNGTSKQTRSSSSTRKNQ
jgi:hypothetical protein